MSSYGYTNPFTVCFTTMKMRYADYDSSIEKLNFVNRDDKVNVFINLESVLNNLSTVSDIDNKLLLERNFPTILESEAINLCAHYKRFFRGNGLPTRVFLYYTDLSSSMFQNFKYNDEYRSFYINKYTINPKFQLLGNKMVEEIIPRIQKIMEFIPDVNFINAKDTEGSLVPLIIANEDKSYKNFIISTDYYETQYQLDPGRFCMHYIKRSPTGAAILDSFKKTMSYMLKENPKDNDGIELLSNPSFYSALIGAMGDKLRSIDPLKGIGSKSTIKFLSNAIKDNIITKDTTSIEMIAKAFPEDQNELAIENYNCINLSKQYSELEEKDIFSITSQIVNRFDYNSLIKLNQTIYKDYPLMLQELTC